MHSVSPFEGKRYNIFDSIIHIGEDTSANQLESPSDLLPDTQRQTVRLLGFSPTKQKQIKTFPTNGIAIRLRARRHLDNAGKPEYVMSDYSEIRPTEVDFTRINTEWRTFDLALLYTYPINVAYAVEGQVVSLAQQEMTTHQDLPRQSSVSGAGTHSIHIMLWGKLCNSVLLGQSFSITSVKLSILMALFHNLLRYVTACPRVPY